MRFRKSIFAMIMFLGSIALSACTTSEPQSYLSRSASYKTITEIPEITQLLLKKEERKLYLLHGDRVVRSYKIDLGFDPEGHKLRRGDGRTPEGLYHIDRRNPHSQFHLSLGISYPNAADRARAHASGVNPGGDIFIHGEAGRSHLSGTDWTAGCIALPDEKIEEIFALVDIGTPILITR